MKIPSRAIVLAVVLASGSGACSTAQSDEETGKASFSASRVCGGFANRSAVAQALRAATAVDRFSDARSKPEQTLQSLTNADGKVSGAELLGSPYCRLQDGDSGDEVLTISFRQALTVDKADPEDERHFTFFQTGLSALASEHTAGIYFNCRMNDSRKEIIIHGDLELEKSARISNEKLTNANMQLLNAAASKVSVELGCRGSSITSSMPTEGS
ncbi:hypothetical protein [Streptomyces sp. AHA2]|uniref:hypothetical protein n=1 Tax=Streptomyces sp. AHA2 TaxID=3064526 RepID=UPI002FE1ABA6